MGAATKAYIGLGSNVGARLGHLRRAVCVLLDHPEIVVRAVSPVYETEYDGPGRQADYLNACLRIQTSLAPLDLLVMLKSVEERFGRSPDGHLAPRTIDLDILVYGDLTCESAQLTLPHPRLHQRAFVLVPLADIAPDLRLPDCGETVAEVCAKILARNDLELRRWAERPLLPEGSGGREEDWRAALAVHWH